MPLSDVLIKNAKPGPKAQRLFDGGGLYLEVAPSGGKWWRLKYRHDGKEKRLSLGTYPDTSLKDARERRDQARRDLAAGIDPGVKRKAEKETRAVLAANTFEAVAREWHQAVHVAKVSEGHAARNLLRLEQDAFPWLGSIPIADITAPKLLEALRRVEARGAIETAHRVRQVCGQVFRYGIATGRCERDPAADLRDALQPVIVTHHAAIIDPKQVGALLRAFDDYQGLPTTRAALKLAPLVFLRPGELRQAEWAEFDLDAAMWTIPAARMKRTKQQKLSGAPHLVPLSSQAVAILLDLEPLTGRGRFVFPSPRGATRPMSENGVLSALRRMGFSKEEMSGHGFRAMARTLMSERLGIPEAVIEAQLAHAVKDSLGRAYNRTEFVEQRRSMMQTWADYLDSLRQGGQVLPFKTA
ncbi:MAG: integrase arm-type DNA-binding domain-containing protein [Aquabacterium commune]|uniref:tyrosine-type recombinase/integrase n=1 Tax=Aquabacterium TaxID=92793 RepID=UPI001DB3BA40|nr:integrase arm-type DNA-binding domain-containing protein [Aquabacterium sp.]MBT9608752.1 integrase arm-type DNA-binding domain-containing protein [Aquabacterium sp.]